MHPAEMYVAEKFQKRVAQTAGLLYRRLPSRQTSRRPAACDTADRRSALPGRIAVLLVFLAIATHVVVADEIAPAPYGLSSRPSSKPFLGMPTMANAVMPPRLSQTGAFKDTRHLAPSDALIPYDLNVAFWSDGAAKFRWIVVPDDQRIQFSPTGEWSFPAGTVFVKHFELATDETHPDQRRRLETRLLVCGRTGEVYGVTYKWRADESDADLLDTNLTETIPIRTATGVRTQSWYYPSRSDCLTCHTPNAGGVLGVKTRQLNRNFKFPSGIVDNELRAWNHAGLFAPQFDEAALSHFDRLASADDTTRSLEERARSYLDVNCAYCHRPRGTVAFFDARYDTPLAKQELIDGRILIDEGVDRARVIAPNDIWRSILFMRMNTLDAIKMPPLARNEPDRHSIALVRQWIESLPGPTVLAPPEISPPGGEYKKAVEVTLHGDQGAVIHYTLDGSTPTADDPVYRGSLKLTDTTILRARSFKPGSTRSIVAQQIFTVNR